MSARRCSQCGGPIPDDAHPRTKYCSDACRRKARSAYQTRWARDKMGDDGLRSYRKAAQDRRKEKHGPEAVTQSNTAYRAHTLLRMDEAEAVERERARVANDPALGVKAEQVREQMSLAASRSYKKRMDSMTPEELAQYRHQRAVYRRDYNKRRKAEEGMPPIQLYCTICGAPLPTTARRNAKYCSDACRSAGRLRATIKWAQSYKDKQEK